MKRFWIAATLALGLVAAPLPAAAQPPAKIPRIGYLDGASLSGVAGRIEAFRQGLRDLGYIEGKNIVIEWRSAEGKADRLPGLAAELVHCAINSTPGETTYEIP